MDWLNIPFVKEITSHTKPYECELFLKNKWIRVVYTGISKNGLWFIEYDREFILTKEEIIAQKDSLKYRVIN